MFWLDVLAKPTGANDNLAAAHQPAATRVSTVAFFARTFAFRLETGIHGHSAFPRFVGDVHLMDIPEFLPEFLVSPNFH